MFDAVLLVEEEAGLFLLPPQPDHPHHLPRAETGSPNLRVAPHQHAGSFSVAAEQHSPVDLVVLLDRLICFLGQRGRADDSESVQVGGPSLDFPVELGEGVGFDDIEVIVLEDDGVLLVLMIFSPDV